MLLYNDRRGLALTGHADTQLGRLLPAHSFERAVGRKKRLQDAGEFWKKNHPPELRFQRAASPAIIPRRTVCADDLRF
jgi:hypothetical protein